jgi:hypothetical protein
MVDLESLMNVTFQRNIFNAFDFVTALFVRTAAWVEKVGLHVHGRPQR